MEHTEPYEKVKFTAVEWLYLQLIKNPKTPWNDILEQAKEMEKEQMIKFAFDVYYDISNKMKVPFNLISENRLHSEYYYNQTFNNEELSDWDTTLNDGLEDESHPE
jgi:hypothetical protein